MKHSEAAWCLRLMQWSIQKSRSTMKEMFGDTMAETLLGDLHPWLAGNKNLLPVLSKMLDRIDNGEITTPLEFYNMMVLARKEPAIWMVATTCDEKGLPEPSIEWLQGWDNE